MVPWRTSTACIMLFSFNSNMQAPEIVAMYTLPVSPAYVRHAIRQKFETNRNVTDSRAVDILLHQSRQDYQECMNVWKLPDHVMGILLKSNEPPQKSFLQKFYEGEWYRCSRRP